MRRILAMAAVLALAGCGDQLTPTEKDWAAASLAKTCKNGDVIARTPGGRLMWGHYSRGFFDEGQGPNYVANGVTLEQVCE